MTQDEPSPLARRIKAAREAKGWTPGRLDREAKLTGGSVGAYEEKGREPSITTLRQLAEALGVELIDLLDTTLASD